MTQHTLGLVELLKINTALLCDGTNCIKQRTINSWELKEKFDKKK